MTHKRTHPMQHAAFPGDPTQKSETRNRPAFNPVTTDQQRTSDMQAGRHAAHTKGKCAGPSAQASITHRAAASAITKHEEEHKAIRRLPSLHSGPALARTPRASPNRDAQPSKRSRPDTHQQCPKAMAADASRHNPRHAIEHQSSSDKRCSLRAIRRKTQTTSAGLEALTTGGRRRHARPKPQTRRRACCASHHRQFKHG